MSAKPGRPAKRRQSGSIDKLPSGRWRARHRGPDGHRHAEVFRTKADADAWLATQHTDAARGAWVDPRAGRVTVAAWSARWLEHRPNLRPTTLRLYRYLLDHHVLPKLGGLELTRLTPSAVRGWHAALLEQRPSVAPKAYQLLRTMMNTAVLDGAVGTNPCRVKGAGEARNAERPIATVPEIEALVDALESRYRALALLAYWCGLRLGELRALRRADLDLLHAWVEVHEQIVDVAGRLITGPPKTEAGRRRVAIPPHVRPALEHHLAAFVGTEAGAFVFTGPAGAGPLPSATWRRAWDKARRASALQHLHLHDLRHSGNTLAAATGASTRELMSRMGHASARAALIYQHATSDRDQAIAAALSELVKPAPIVPITGPQEGVSRTVGSRLGHGATSDDPASQPT